MEKWGAELIYQRHRDVPLGALTAAHVSDGRAMRNVA